MTEPATMAAAPMLASALATREQLLRVAMALFGENGVDRVSLLQIADAAGSRNKSAVGYHFASKQGLVDALLQRIERDIGQPIEAALADIQARFESGETVSLGDVVRAVLAPVFGFYGASPYGRDAFRVLARLMHDPVESIPLMLRRDSAARIARFSAILQRLQPGKPQRLIEHHVHHSIMATINGLSLTDRFLALRRDRWGGDELPLFLDSYAGFLAAGLASGAAQTK